MKYRSITYVFVLIILIILPVLTSAEESMPYFIQAFHKHCEYGLYPQPNDGPFSVYLFCDDALGSNIGVINTQPTAGPGKLKLTGTKTWDKWYTYDRFWQEKIWATDVVNFAWSPFFRYLYVATSSVYGDGGFFKLDLKNREFIRLLPKLTAKYYPKLKMGYLTQIERFDVVSKELTVGVYLYGIEKELIATEKLPID